ncbi:hypothetical protein C8C77_12159 [Halanaerobium saccharolyticum]|uniref:Uncharacterized protein n=1 Tax=Halanaerobium saccharolyticum TaxID=43595 RepID=A0A4R7YUC9_9FIRM|nr:hypothetical protein [Halanaerobium saccharolyticum]RAK06723.1 hypothetical protein C7958_12059 [Halanaerobium saccharolyticum]TDW01360.1 hypothetical protein C8C77_12159 [Halanaerobium saccharolyticum]TDX52828.1 hypothetical protein C7956_12159 [Halanaerobium saccharolyticum]
MSRKSFVVGLILVFVFVFSSGVSAQLSNFYGLDNMLMSDWQLDYIRPLDPGELKKGEFRLSPVIGRITDNYDQNNIDGDYDGDYDNSTMAYIMIFDAKFTDKLSLHSKFAYQPWEEYDSRYLSGNNESRSTMTDLFFNYEFKEDRTMFFGYNRSLNKEKEYDEANILEDEIEKINNIYYLGFEIRGSFMGKN